MIRQSKDMFGLIDDGCLNKRDVLHRLMYFTNWSPVGGAVCGSGIDSLSLEL